MAWVKTLEDEDRHVQMSQVVWANVQAVDGGGWDVVVYAPSAGQFAISHHATQTLAETALTALVATW